MHTGGGGEREEGGTSCTPSKDFEKWHHRNTIKHETRGPQEPPLGFENDCEYMLASLADLIKCLFLFFKLIKS